MACNTHEIVPVENDGVFAYFLCLDCDIVADIDDYHVSEYNGAEVERQGDEFVCLDCLTVVPPVGHDRDECRDAARDRMADMSADYRY